MFFIIDNGISVSESNAYLSVMCRKSFDYFSPTFEVEVEAHGLMDSNNFFQHN